MHKWVVAAAFFGCLWCLVAWLLLEVYETLRQRPLQMEAALYRNEISRRQDEKSAEYLSRCPPPENRPAAARWPSPAAYWSLDDAGKTALAQQRQEVLLLSACDGIIQKRYGDASLVPALGIFDILTPGVSFFSILPKREAQDARQTIDQACADSGQQDRWYVLPWNANPWVYEAAFLAPSGSPARENFAAILLRDSIWEEVGQKMKPGKYHPAMCGHEEVWTNRQGWRDDEIALPKPPGTYRIICIGGSTTIEGPRNDLTYPKLLEKKFRQAFPDKRIEVINAGVYAQNTQGESERLEDYLALEPNLIIHYNFINDIVPLLYPYRSDLVTRGGPWQWIKNLLGHSRFVYDRYNPWLLPPFGVIKNRFEAFTFTHLRQIAEASRACGARLVVCSFAYPEVSADDPLEYAYFDYFTGINVSPHLVNFDGYVHLVSFYNTCLKSWCAAEGLLYLPVAENLHGGTDKFSDLCHLQPSVIPYKADIVFSLVKDLVLAESG